MRFAIAAHGDPARFHGRGIGTVRGEGATRLDRGEDADQAFRDPVALGDGAGLGFFGMTAGGGGGRGQVDIRALGRLRHVLGPRLQLGGGRLGIGGEVLEQHRLGVQEARKGPRRVQTGQVALEDQAVKGRERAGDHVAMYTQEGFHGLSPGIMVGVGPSGSPYRRLRAILQPSLSLG